MERYRVAGRKRAKSRILLIILVMVLAAAVVGGCLWWLSRRDHGVHSNNSGRGEESSIKRQDPVALQGKYLFNGTVVWSRGVEKDSEVPGGYDYAKPFNQLQSFNKSQYDAWMASFECPITNKIVSFASQVRDVSFNCRPEFLAEASKYFEFYDLANNHTGDQGGVAGLKETRQYLDSTPGVQYFGHFDPSIAADVCEVVALPVRIQEHDATEQKSKIPVALCAWHYFFRQPLPGEIAVMDAYAKIMPVFAFVEMGTEYQPAANAIQESIAHQIVDHGPEFLIANNPHWVQNTEVYKDTLIVYATGNFIFDQLEPEERRSASIDVTMTIPYSENVKKWIGLADTCTSFQDTCLEKATSLGLKKLTPTYAYGVVAGQGGYRVSTHRADSATQAAVEQRMNWQQTLGQLGQ